jgi:DNA polymerase-3 subunit epsilon
VQYVRPFVVLDFETTGLRWRGGDRITEVAALRMVDGEVSDRYVSLVNCGVAVPASITRYTGITQAMVDGAPPVAEVLPRLLAFLGQDVVVAHNAHFDRGFLERECALGACGRSYGSFACSVRLARRILPGLKSYSLAELARHAGLARRGAAHRAESDAELTAGLARVLVARAARTWRFDRFDPELFLLTQRLPVRTVAPLFAPDLPTQARAAG